MHGLTGTPEEMRPLGEALAAAGFPVRVVRLAGHGTALADLVRTRWTDWFESVVEGAEALRAETGLPIAVAGMSLGGLLTLHLAATRAAEVAAIVICGTPLRLDDRRLATIPFLVRSPWLPAAWRMIPKPDGPDVADPVMRAGSRSYRATPLVSVAELLRLQATVRAEIGAIAQPALVLHGAQDHSVPVANLELARATLGSSWIETHMLAESWHVITMDVERAEVGRLAADFLGRVAAAETPAARRAT